MILKNLRERSFVKKNVYESIDSLALKLKRIRKNHSTLAICPSTTGNSWQGVQTATLGLFPENTLILPQYYSKTVYTDKEIFEICELIRNNHFENIVLSGYPGYFKKIIEKLFFYTKIKLIYHGSFASNREDENSTIFFLNEIIELAKLNKIHSLGFVKKGMAESFEIISGISTSHILLVTNKAKIKEKQYINNDTINIGVFTHNQYRKNIDNQVAAALMINNSIIHLKNNYNFGYFHNPNRFNIHGFFNSHNDFLKVLASMNVNLYVSFSECWGQVITESLMLGVPCLAADNSGVLDYDIELANFLIVKEFDNSTAIYKQTQLVLENNKWISKRGMEYIDKLNKMALLKISEFLR